MKIRALRIFCTVACRLFIFQKKRLLFWYIYPYHDEKKPSFCQKRSRLCRRSLSKMIEKVDGQEKVVKKLTKIKMPIVILGFIR